ncbi:MAG TPA: cytochrome c oxidase assembly protein [Candidatus Dormibacteraeota bacterium]|nr:cytochrome c oxidase assembly protein [Candidatus Dormibacteraeota bacterium]
MGLQALPLPWNFDLVLLAGLATAAVAYLFLERQQDAPGRPRFFWLGLLCFFVALVTPVDYASDRYLLAAHMIQHILITMVGPPLVLAGLPLGTARYLPRFLGNPWLTVLLFNGVLLVWHIPALYQATLLNEDIHILEHLLLIGTAFLFWVPVVGPVAETRGQPPLMKIGYLALAGLPPTVIGMTLALAPFVIYPFYSVQPRLFADLSALVDQQLAGLLMFGLGNLIYFVPISVIFLRISEEPEAVQAGS